MDRKSLVIGGRSGNDRKHGHHYRTHMHRSIFVVILSTCLVFFLIVILSTCLVFFLIVIRIIVIGCTERQYSITTPHHQRDKNTKSTGIARTGISNLYL